MYPIKIAGETRNIGKPKDWNDEELGVCGSLSVQDIVADNGLDYMVSAWVPDTEELHKILKGEPIFLWIQGTPITQHPVVSLSVG